MTRPRSTCSQRSAIGASSRTSSGSSAASRARARLYEAAIVRTLVAVRAREALPALRTPARREPDDRLARRARARRARARARHRASASSRTRRPRRSSSRSSTSTSQEYRARPAARGARRSAACATCPALAGLERLLFSPKEPVTCEVVWAVGAIGQAHADARDRAAALLDRLTGLEPGAEITRLAALAKLRDGEGRAEDAPSCGARSIARCGSRRSDRKRRRDGARGASARSRSWRRSPKTDRARGSTPALLPRPRGGPPLRDARRSSRAHGGRVGVRGVERSRCRSRAAVLLVRAARISSARRPRRAARGGARSARHLPSQRRHASRRDPAMRAQSARSRRRPHASSRSRRRRRTSTTTRRPTSWRSCVRSRS